MLYTQLMYYKNKLSVIKSMRWSIQDVELMGDLKKNSVDVHRFIRNAFRQKIEMDMMHILQNEKEKQDHIKAPF